MPLRPVNRWAGLILAGALAAGQGLVDARAQVSSSSSYSVEAVRAAYLVNFIRFSEWPESAPGSPFTLGIVGNRELEDRLIMNTEGKFLQGRRIRVRRLTIPADAPDCQLVYIQPAPRTDTSAFSTDDWLKAVRFAPVLTVSAEAGFLQKGGMINFYADNQNLRFEISPRAAELAGLQISSRLLAIARIVKVDSPPDSAP